MCRPNAADVGWLRRSGSPVPSRPTGQRSSSDSPKTSPPTSRPAEALREGRLSEYRATLVARETGCLDTTDRHHVDDLVMGDPDTYLLGTRQLAAEIDAASTPPTRSLWPAVPPKPPPTGASPCAPHRTR